MKVDLFILQVFNLIVKLQLVLRKSIHSCKKLLLIKCFINHYITSQLLYRYSQYQHLISKV